MANLKADLLNELRNQKYYAEMELLRLAQDPSMNYRKKILDIDKELEHISLLNQKIALADGYFQTPEQPMEQPVVEQSIVEQPVPEAPQPVPVVNQPQPGQSHGE